MSAGIPGTFSGTNWGAQTQPIPQAGAYVNWPTGLVSASAPPPYASINPTGGQSPMMPAVALAIRNTQSLTARPGNKSDAPLLVHKLNPIPIGSAPVTTMPARTVSGRKPYRADEGPIDKPSTYPPQPNRRAYAPQRASISAVAQEMQKTRNVMRNSLGFDARINENLTMHIPDSVLPPSFRSGAQTTPGRNT
jgi:hypothetical protein